MYDKIHHKLKKKKEKKEKKISAFTPNSIFVNVFSSVVEKNSVFQKRDPRAMENHESPPREGT